MIKIKHWMDAAEAGDGVRMWVEPVQLTRDLREWCKVDHVLCHLGPPTQIWEWFEEHPDGYGYFRAEYHDFLRKFKYRPALQQIACAGAKQNFTLLYQGDDECHNTATALYEFITELSSYCPPEKGE